MNCYIHDEVWGEITDPFWNFNDAISSHTLPGVLVLNHTEIKVNPC